MRDNPLLFLQGDKKWGNAQVQTMLKLKNRRSIQILRERESQDSNHVQDQMIRCCQSMAQQI